MLNTIAANMRTEELLKQSQALTEELQSQQEELTETNKRLEQQTRSLQKSEELLRNQQDELQKTNVELEEKAQLLAEQKAEVEQKNKEVEQAKVALEEKAEQLALTSKYKSEFLANMSHELRTPLNSLLILSQMLRENADGNLTTKQVEFAQTIHSSGSDLLDLINDILDLSKIESGTMAVDIDHGAVRRGARSSSRAPSARWPTTRAWTSRSSSTRRCRRPSRPTPSGCSRCSRTCSPTPSSSPSGAASSLRASVATERLEPGAARCSTRANTVIAFSVTDTGIGIPKEKHGVIFEAFQQGDGTTSRKYGGTGLGLSISREITRLLGGEIRIESAPGEGSTFTLYLPLIYPAQPVRDAVGATRTAPAARPRPPSRPSRCSTASSRVVAGAGGRAGGQRRPGRRSRRATASS